MLHDPLAAALSKIYNAENVGKKEVEIRPASKMIITILELMHEHGYIGSFELIEEGPGRSMVKINLLGSINKCNVIKPRFSTRFVEYTKWEKRYLPARDFGFLVISTPAGIMTHYDAKEKRIGGKLLAYCY
jgi:small subunit ribosomal protein S8